MVAFNKKKREGKEISRQKTGALTPHRTLETREALALSTVYKKRISSDIPVYRLSGAYRNQSLTVNHSTQYVHYFGDVVVQPHPGIAENIALATQLEVIELDSKDGALIVSIDELMNAETEVKIKQAMEEGVSYEKSGEEESFSLRPGRPMTFEENLQMNGDGRFLITLAILVLLFVPVYISSIYVGLPALAAAAALFIYFYLPQFPQKVRKEYETQIMEGVIRKLNGQYRMNLFSLVLPKDGPDSLEPGEKIVLEGVVQGKEKNEFHVLSINGFSYFKFKPSFFRHYTTLAVGTVLALFMLFSSSDIPYKIKTIKDYYLSRGMQVEFNGYDEIESFPFKEGQYVELTGLYSLPNMPFLNSYSNCTLVGASVNQSMPDFSEAYEYLSYLDALQGTEEYLEFFAYGISDTDLYYDFVGTIYYNSLNTSIEDLRPYFEGEESFEVLYEAVVLLYNIDEDATRDDLIPADYSYLLNYLGEGTLETLGDLVDAVNTIMDNFFYRQGLVINEMVRNTVSEYMAGQDYNVIMGVSSGQPYYDASRSELGKYYSTTGYSRSYETWSTLPALKELYDFEEELSQSYHPLTTIKGTITHIFYEEDIRYIDLMESSRGSQDILLYAVHIALFAALVALMVYALVKIVLKDRISAI